ncbi:MAG TPA: substrate-binding domain-containing protein [Candidatus Dormibacteraeota bacterium]|nr:substrate-binding domain-containing protein [Candidatus Dormibacteraeota bacterium]
MSPETDSAAANLLRRPVSRRDMLKGGLAAGGLVATGGAGVLLDACSTGSTSSSSPTAATTNFSGVKLNIFSGGYTIPYEQLAQTAWKTKTGGDVNITNVPFGDRPAKIAGLIASKDSSFDLIYMYDGYMKRYGDRLLLDLTDVVGDKTDFLPVTMKTLTAPSGVIKAGPMHGEHMVLLWNKGLFSSIGATSAPETWADAFAMAPKFKDKGIIPLAIPMLTATYGNFYWTFFINSLFPNPIISPDYTQILFDNADGLSSFQTIKAGLDAGFFDPNSMTATDEYAVALLYNSGKMAMHLGWTEHYKDAISGDVKNYQATINPADVQAALVPGVKSGTSGSVNGIEGLGINKYGKNIEACKSFIKELISPEVGKQAVLSPTVYPPTRFSVLADSEVLSHFKIAKVWGDQAKANLDLHNAPYDLAPVIDEAIGGLVRGKYSAQAAHKAAVDGSKAAIVKWLSQ